MRVVGIDPSLAGEVAALDADGQLRHLHDPPVMAIRVGRQTRQDDDLPAMRRRPVSYAGASCHVCIEPQQARPRQGGSSLFKLGVRYGLWLGVMATVQPLHTPRVPRGREALCGASGLRQGCRPAARPPTLSHGRPGAQEGPWPRRGVCIAYPGLRHPPESLRE
jgi:hypothetical protein